MRHVDNGYRHFFNNLVVITPGIEEGIEQGNDDTEDEHALVTNDRDHFLLPNVAHVLNAFNQFVPYTLIMFHRNRLWDIFVF